MLQTTPNSKRQRRGFISAWADGPGILAQEIERAESPPYAYIAFYTPRVRSGCNAPVSQILPLPSFIF